MSVLLVEDDPEDVALTTRALSQNHLVNRIHVARDGAEALAYLQEAERPRVILLDLKLPKVTGLEVLRRIRQDERLHRLPVVILTSSREEPDIRQAYDLGVNSYIVKPVDIEQFIRAVSEAGLYWLLLNEPPSD